MRALPVSSIKPLSACVCVCDPGQKGSRAAPDKVSAAGVPPFLFYFFCFILYGFRTRLAIAAPSFGSSQSALNLQRLFLNANRADTQCSHQTDAVCYFSLYRYK